MKHSRGGLILAFWALLAVYLIRCWVDGSKHLSACVCAVCTTATPEATAMMESEWGY
jgi:hypothetical protein